MLIYIYLVNHCFFRESAGSLPVLVYIHGGFLHFGSGHEAGFSPSASLAAELNAVVVSFNYRLNVFGWLALKVSRCREFNRFFKAVKGSSSSIGIMFSAFYIHVQVCV